MWKFVPRGLRESLERGFNVYRRQDIGREKKNCCILDSFKCISGSPCDNEYKKQKAYFKQDGWIRAVSCSGALALGWALSQPCIWKKWFYDRPCDLGKLDLTRKLGVVYLQPEDKNDKSFDAVDSAIEYGPLTAEEALNEGIENFINVHNGVWAEIENSKGIACIETKEERKALKHFLKSSRLGYAPAEYNIAQCYELGIGVHQNFTKAAHWYQKAAAKGHPTALYNLGVFHAHGWGGLEASSKKAKKLFAQAAAKGQPNAQAALGLKTNETELPPIDFEDKNCDEFSSSDLSNDSDYLFNLASDYESSDKPDPSKPEFVYQLYNVASDLGHKEAKSRFQVMQIFNLIGLLEDYVCSNESKNLNEDQEVLTLAEF